MNALDNLLNRITMYRLVVYVLGVYIVLAVIYAFLGRLAVPPTELIISLALLVGSAYITDRVFSYWFKVPTNRESYLITALILFLILQPAQSLVAGAILVLAGVISSASKFIVALRGKHMFNPAAFAAAVLALTGLQATTWWIGSSLFWPLTLVCGMAIVRKMRQFWPVFTFAAVSIALQYPQFLSAHQPLMIALSHALVASPLIFLSTVMLTEPATMPPRRSWQIGFAALVAVLYVYAWQIGPFIIYPEVALLIGNLFAWFVSPKMQVRLRLKQIQKISSRIYHYTFEPDRRFAFTPGQYIDLTMPNVPYDSRGNRRTFTIASAPTELNVQIGVKLYEPASMYKIAFTQLQPGDIVYASRLAGDFTLTPRATKLAFVAGGIGITPFRSIIKYLIDQNISLDIILLYAVSDPHEFAYMRLFAEAAKVGVKVVPVVTNDAYHEPHFVTARLDDALIKQYIPDYNDRVFYVSGPNGMVQNTKEWLQSLEVSALNIKTDHFSGY